MKINSSGGFALITVLCVVLIVSAVALSLASSMRLEVREVAAERSALQAEQLCAAGQDMATYLVGRGLGTPLENFEGLPVEVVRPGFHYVIHFPAGDVDLFLDAEDGKLNLSTAPEPVLEAFFGFWSGDSNRAMRLTSAVVDWRDPDESPRDSGAEREFYEPLGYLPRNRTLGSGDVLLVSGFSLEDFRASVLDVRRREDGSLQRRPGLTEFLTSAPVGATVNPNFAPELLLRSLPGLDPYVDRAILLRKEGLFKDAQDFSVRVGVPVDSPILTFLHFNRRVPLVLTVARSPDGKVVRSERRMLVKGLLAQIERHVLPDYARFVE